MRRRTRRGGNSTRLLAQSHAELAAGSGRRGSTRFRCAFYSCLGRTTGRVQLPGHDARVCRARGRATGTHARVAIRARDVWLRPGPRRGRWVMKVRVHSPETRAGLGAGFIETDAGRYTVRCERISATIRRQRGSPLEVWVCEGRDRRARYAIGNNIYLYRVTTPRAPVEWVREARARVWAPRAAGDWRIRADG